MLILLEDMCGIGIQYPHSLLETPATWGKELIGEVKPGGEEEDIIEVGLGIIKSLHQIMVFTPGIGRRREGGRRK